MPPRVITSLTMATGSRARSTPIFTIALKSPILSVDYRLNRHVDDPAPGLAQQLLILLGVPYPLGVHIEHLAVLEGDGERLRDVPVLPDGPVPWIPSVGQPSALARE